MRTNLFNMNQKELYQALHRAIGNVFQLHGSIIPVFEDVFTEYPLEDIKTMEPSELEGIIHSLSEKRGDVRNMRALIDYEIDDGESSLKAAAGVIFDNLAEAHIISREESNRSRDHSSQEILAYSHPLNQNPIVIARGQFPLDVDLNDVVFTPYKVFYNDENLEWMMGPEGQPTLILDDCAVLRKTATVTVFEEKTTDKKDHQIVKEVTQFLADHYPKRESQKNNYRSIQGQLVRALRTMFPSIEHEKGGVNHHELVKIFRKVKRKNIDLHQYVRFKDQLIADILMKGVDEIVSGPYAVVKSRVKQRERAFDKMIEAFYNLRGDGYQGGPKTFRDLYGLRVILPTESDIYACVRQLKNIKSFEIVRDEAGKSGEKNFIKRPKANGYQSYHMPVKFAGRVYELQLRTHEMDFRAETDPEQAHDAYKENKRKEINSTPLNVRKIVSVCLGLPPPSE